MKYISFSLFGDSPKYIQGAIRNVELAAQFYPDWKCFFYVDHKIAYSNPIATLLDEKKAHVRIMADSEHDVDPLSWRFMIADLVDAERFIIRDADSRIGQREVDAVNAWIASGMPFHVMRDHPAHGRFICGGMWGSIGGFLPNIRQSYLDWYRAKGREYKGTDPDQQFLEDVITPQVRNKCLQHDSFRAKEFGAIPFPTKRIGQRFVGEVWDQNEIPREHDWIQIPIEN